MKKKSSLEINIKFPARVTKRSLSPFQQAEKAIYQELLRKFEGRITHVSDYCGYSINTVRVKLVFYGLEWNKYSSSIPDAKP